MGRYSTLSLFQKIGIQLGTDAVPLYYDGAFKFNWQLKNGGALSLFGIGGQSKIDIMISEQTEYSAELYGEGDRDQHFGTSMGVTGLNFKKPLNEKTFIAATVSYSSENQHAMHEYLYGRRLDSTGTTIQFDSLRKIMGYTFKTSKASAYFSVNHKFNKRHLIKAGFNADMYFFNMIDSVRPHVDSNYFNLRWDYTGTSMLIQPFIQWKWRVTENFDFTAGLHSQYFSQSNSISPIEPRLGWKYRMKNDQSLFMGAGLHSSTQPIYTYFYHQLDSQGNKVYHNKNMDFSKSLHSGIGYEKVIKKKLNIRTEAYYQYLYNIPVTIAPSSFSLINMGSGFARFFPEPLKNTGTGFNYGLELTVQKYFDKSFFFLFSGTVYNSRYVGSDGVERNTSYNGNYVTNLLAGKEFKLNEKNTLGLGFKVTYAGGKRYGYANDSLSRYFNEVIFEDDKFNERRFKDYFRMDFKISWRMNAEKLTHEIGLDLVNILNTKNYLGLAYAPNLSDPSKEPFINKTQLGFLPIFYYKIDFRIKPKE
jgi:hypothetical protein